jgi:mannose PTS system EIID component
MKDGESSSAVKSPLQYGALLKSFARSFFLQTLWNYERMQNMGFAFGVSPLLKASRDSREGYIALVRRHTEFFNTHPYLAPVVMGLVYERERQRPEDRGPGIISVSVLKNSMGAAFGAVGDHVIWGTWRPFCLLLMMALGLLVAFPSSEGGFVPSLFDRDASTLCAAWWVFGTLSLFNALQIWLRWQGLMKAAQLGPQVVGWVQSLELQRWASQIRRLGLVVVGAMCLGYLSRWRDSAMLVWMFGVMLGAVILKRWSFSGLWIFYLVCGASVVMTRMGIHWP